MTVDTTGLRAALAEATPGPWIVAGSPGFFRTDNGQIVGSTLPVDGLPTSPADAALIVALRNSAEALLDELDAARRVVAAARELRRYVSYATRSTPPKAAIDALDTSLSEFAALAEGRTK